MKHERTGMDWLLVLGAATLIGAALHAGGCAGSTKVENRSTTVGQELKDLEDARNKGLLTEDEYNKKRQEILKGK